MQSEGPSTLFPGNSYGAAKLSSVLETSLPPLHRAFRHLFSLFPSQVKCGVSLSVLLDCKLLVMFSLSLDPGLLPVRGHDEMWKNRWMEEGGGGIQPRNHAGKHTFHTSHYILSRLLGQHWRLLNRVYALTMFKLNTASFLEKQRVSKSRAERGLRNHLVEPCLKCF